MHPKIVKHVLWAFIFWSSKVLGWIPSPRFVGLRQTVLIDTVLHSSSDTIQNLHTGGDANTDGSFGLTDSEFEDWLIQELEMEVPELYMDNSLIFNKMATCMRKWRERFRGNRPLWKRLFKRDRVIKEIIESMPIVDAVDQWVKANKQDDDLPQNVTIVDLCSGKGYLSMILSEYLPADANVEKCVLVDKAWPMCFAELKNHHINWEHIYGNTTDGLSYFSSWPIPLHTSKQNIKASSSLRSMKKRLSKGPVLVLAVHLCGTLSIQAIKLFHQLPESKMLILKPCCLPGMGNTKDKENFIVGRYKFPTKDVCAPGKFRGNVWVGGPPRWQLEGKFNKWCNYLYEAVQDDEHVLSSRIYDVPIQNKGFQNTFIYAEK